MTWRERNVAARQRGSFTDDEKADAMNWCRCAVGEQCRAMPGVIAVAAGTYVPVDERLHLLGDEAGFGVAVNLDNFDRVDDLLDAIEDRVLQLKREQP